MEALEQPTSEQPTTHASPMALIGTAAACIIGGGCIGASTNAVNGVVSPDYFRSAMRWDDVQNIWRAILAQGIFEGLIYGVLFAVVFTLVVGIVSRAQCPLGFALQHLLAILAAIYGCWVLGGLLGMGLAALSPEFFQRTFIDVPDAAGSMQRYAWVGGSIWGAMAGSVLAAGIGSILFAARWRRRHPPVGAN